MTCPHPTFSPPLILTPAVFIFFNYFFKFIYAGPNNLHAYMSHRYTNPGVSISMMYAWMRIYTETVSLSYKCPRAPPARITIDTTIGSIPGSRQ